MPRKRRPAFEDAVTASPLFKLALEVRIMIYELLLIQEGGMFIPSDIFARRDYGRQGSTPYECGICGFVSLSSSGCEKHIQAHDRGIDIVNSATLRPIRPLLPAVSIALLQTCRLMRLEASPILYTRNGFHFSDPATASNFRWGTDCTQAGAIQEIGIRFGSNYFRRFETWMTYFSKQTLSLGQEFPHLRRMIIDLDVWIGMESAGCLLDMCKGFGNRNQGLEWVLILTLLSEEVLDCFEPLVHREDDPANGQKEMRRHTWTNKEGGPWKNGLIWWGSPGEAMPHKYRLIGDQPQEKTPSEGTNKGGSKQPTAPAT